MNNIVALGGGSGLFTLLSGLKEEKVSITAVVSMADSGGSTGFLRDQLGVLPPGDVRKCIIALSQSSGLMKDLLSFRFSKGEGLNGHNFGNLLISALTCITGSDQAAIKEASKILNIKGEVLPVTLDSSHLCAVLENGQIVERETKIDIPTHNPFLHIKEAFLEPEAIINPDAKQAILDADLIILGPGDLFTSIIPNLLVKGVKEAIQQSDAKKVFICNLMTKLGESTDFKASDFVKTIEYYLGKGILDYVIVNKGSIPSELLDNYAAEYAFPVIVDEENLKRFSYRFIYGDFSHKEMLARHDQKKLALAVMEVLNESGNNGGR